MCPQLSKGMVGDPGSLLRVQERTCLRFSWTSEAFGSANCPRTFPSIDHARWYPSWHASNCKFRSVWQNMGCIQVMAPSLITGRIHRPLPLSPKYQQPSGAVYTIIRIICDRSPPRDQFNFPAQRNRLVTQVDPAAPSGKRECGTRRFP